MSSWKEIERDIELLKEYSSIYVQLLAYCIEGRIKSPQLPTFEYFKEHYTSDSYSLVIPHYSETFSVDNGTICKHASAGIFKCDYLGRRLFNYWMGCKYYTDGNISGEFTINNGEVSELLKVK